MSASGGFGFRTAIGAALTVPLLCLWLCLPLSAWPDAGGLHYDLDIAPTGLAEIDAAIERASLLVALRDDEPVVPLALIARVQTDVGRMDDVLRSFGYYDAVIDMQVAGRDPADPALPAALAAQAGGSRVAISVRIDAGPLYRLAAVAVEGDVPAAGAAFDLRPGEPAAARRVLAAVAAMLEALREDGFALARVPPPRATVDHRARTMDVQFTLEAGPQVAIGAIEITGLGRLREGFVRRRLGLLPGEPYSPSRLEQARRELLASEAIAAARLTPAQGLDAEGRLPLEVAVVERPPRTLRLSGAFASDEGGRVHLGWTHRNLFGGAERLSLRGEIGAIDSTDRDRLDYAAGASLRVPDVGLRNLDVALDLAAVSESLDAYDRDAVTAGAGLELRPSPRLALALGVAFERSRVAQDGPAEDYRLLSLPLALGWDAVDAPLDPQRGLRLKARVVPVPWVAADGPGDGQGFVRADLSASGYLALQPRHAAEAIPGAGAPTVASPTPETSAAQGNTVIAGRVALGRLLGAAARDVPPDWRLYAGGAGSVRGYPLQSIGPRTASDNPAGGDALLEGSLELRHRIHGPWGIVAFADAGSVTADGLADLGEVRVGVGLGLRFHTLIGPLRADLAVPLEPYPGDAPVQLYLGVGQAF